MAGTTDTPVKFGIKTWRDFAFDDVATSTLKVTKLLILPGKTLASPTGLLYAGDFAYDAATQQLIYSDGTVFLPIGTSGEVTSISEGTGITLTPNPITATGTVAVADTTVTPGSYTLSNITVNAQGQLTAASSNTVAATVPTPAQRRFVSVTSTASQTIENFAIIGHAVALNYAAPNPVAVNTSGDLNLTSGTWTCGTPGLYFFSTSMSSPPVATPGSQANLNVTLVHSGHPLSDIGFPQDSFTTPQTSTSMIAKCATGDTVTAQITFYSVAGVVNTPVTFKTFFAFLVST